MSLAPLRALGLAVALLGAGPALAQSTTYYTVTSPADDSNARDKNVGDGVCEDSFTDSNPDAEPRCTLRAAVDEANATSGTVVINLPGQLAGGQSGAYSLARVAPNDADATYEDDNAYGDLDVGAGDAAFSSLTIRGTGTPGPSVTISPNDRVFDVLAGEVRFERITVSGGTARAGDNGVSDPGAGESVDGQDGEDGGCFRIAEGVTATLDQLSVNNCATQSGGNGAAPSAAGTTGGAAGSGGNGGGIANFGTLTVRRSFVAQNVTGDAGSAANGTAGSGQAVAGGAGGNAGSGGGIYSEGDLTIEETTVFGNAAGDPSDGASGTNGGEDGVEGEGGSGGGIAVLAGATATLRNTLVAGNAAGDDVQNGKQPGPDVWDGDPADDDMPQVSFETGQFASEGSNLVGSNNAAEDAFPRGTPNANGDLVGTGDGDDPNRIDPLITGQNQNQDEAVANYPLGAGSPAIDAGATTDLAGNDIALDGRGFRRPGTRDGDTSVDIGAYEFMSVAAPDSLSITELDAVTGDPDDREFVEVTNEGDFPVQLADYALVFFDGADNLAYAQFNLEGELAPGASFVFGNPAVSEATQTFGGAESDIADAEGAVALYRGQASSYPDGAAAGQNEDTRADVIVYDNTGGDKRADASDLAGAFGVPEENVASGDDADNSLQSNGDGTYSPGSPNPGSGGVSAQDAADAGAFSLSAPAPNPARGAVALRLALGTADAARVDLYDALGRRVATLWDGPAVGDVELSVDASRLAPGVYVVRAAAGGLAATRRLTVVR